MLFAVLGSTKEITATNAKIEGREVFSTLITTAATIAALWDIISHPWPGF